MEKERRKERNNGSCKFVVENKDLKGSFIANY